MNDSSIKLVGKTNQMTDCLENHDEQVVAVEPAGESSGHCEGGVCSLNWKPMRPAA